MKFFTVHTGNDGSRLSAMESDIKGSREILNLNFRANGGVIANLDIPTMTFIGENHPQIITALMTKTLTLDMLIGYLMGQGFQKIG